MEIKRSIPLSELEDLHLSNATEDEEKELAELVRDRKVPHTLQGAFEAIVALGSAINAKSDRRKLTMGRMLSKAEPDVVLYEIERRIRESRC